MYLSQLILNPRSRQAQRALNNPYQVHQLVMRGFPDDFKREKAQVLHRLETRDGAVVLIVQSVIEPDWSAIDPAYLVPTGPYDLLPNPAVKAVNLPLRAGQILSFRLRANPSVKKRRPQGQEKSRHSNRVPLVREEKQLEWLQKRAAVGGFRLLRAVVTQSQRQKAWKKGEKDPITLYTVQFDGHLRVEQPDKLLQAVQTGIGPAKAFGCGLLSLAPG